MRLIAADPYLHAARGRRDRLVRRCARIGAQRAPRPDVELGDGAVRDVAGPCAASVALRGHQVRATTVGGERGVHHAAAEVEQDEALRALARHEQRAPPAGERDAVRARVLPELDRARHRRGRQAEVDHGKRVARCCAVTVDGDDGPSPVRRDGHLVGPVPHGECRDRPQRCGVEHRGARAILVRHHDHPRPRRQVGTPILDHPVASRGIEADRRRVRPHASALRRGLRGSLGRIRTPSARQ